MPIVGKIRITLYHNIRHYSRTELKEKRLPGMEALLVRRKEPGKVRMRAEKVNRITSRPRKALRYNIFCLKASNSVDFLA